MRRSARVDGPHLSAREHHVEAGSAPTSVWDSRTRGNELMTIRELYEKVRTEDEGFLDVPFELHLVADGKRISLQFSSEEIGSGWPRCLPNKRYGGVGWLAAEVRLIGPYKVIKKPQKRGS